MSRLSLADDCSSIVKKIQPIISLPSNEAFNVLEKDK